MKNFQINRNYFASFSSFPVAVLTLCLFFSPLSASAQDDTTTPDDPEPALVPKGLFNKKETLPAGTLVLLETNEKVISGEVTVGKTLMFRVRTNVVFDREVLIATGALAIGRVKNIQPGTYNSPEEIVLELQYVQAVDGQQVPLNGNEQRIQAQFAGQGSTAETGLLITAQVMNNISIKLK